MSLGSTARFALTLALATTSLTAAAAPKTKRAAPVAPGPAPAPAPAPAPISSPTLTSAPVSPPRIPTPASNRRTKRNSPSSPRRRRSCQIGNLSNGVSFGLGGLVGLDYAVHPNVALVARAGYVEFIPKSGIDTSLGALPIWAGARYSFLGAEGPYVEGTMGPTILFASVNTRFGRVSDSETKFSFVAGGGYRFSRSISAPASSSTTSATQATRPDSWRRSAGRSSRSDHHRLSLVGETRRLRVRPLSPVSHGAARRGRSRGGPRRSFWIELAWDGHRVLAVRAGDRVRIVSADLSRVERRISRRRARAAQARGARSRRGRVPVRARRSRATLVRAAARARADTASALFAVWDLLHLDGEDLRALPLDERRARLADAVVRAAPASRSPSRSRAGLDAILEATRQNGVPGVFARPEEGAYPVARRPAVDGRAPRRGPLSWTRSLSPAPVVTNEKKVLFPRDGFTKKDIVGLLRDVADACSRSSANDRRRAALAGRHRRVHLVPAPHPAARARLSARRVD